jgi:hypothetical protein
MAMTFPSNPTLGQQYSVSGGPTYTWDGTVWKILTPGSQFSRQSFTATAGQTVFTVSGGYVIGAVDVYRNGVKLLNTSDFTATDLSTVTLVNAANAGDTIEVDCASQVTYTNALNLNNNLSDIPNAATARANLGAVSKAGDQMTGDLTVPSLNGGQLAGMRNRIINGAMGIWQRGVSGFTTLNTYVYAADRFIGFSGVSLNGTFSQVSNIGLPGFQYAMRAQRNAGNTSTSGLVIGQTIESVNCFDLAGSAVTISFWARAGANYSAASNLLYAYLVTGTGVDQGTLAWINSSWTGQVFNNVGSPTLTTSWQKFTYTFTLPSNMTELAFYVQAGPTGTAGANDYFDITGVQLEKGSVATPFENRLYGTELALCQRYYQTQSFGADWVSATYAGGAFVFSPQMRSTPSLLSVSYP